MIADSGRSGSNHVTSKEHLLFSSPEYSHCGGRVRDHRACGHNHNLASQLQQNTALLLPSYPITSSTILTPLLIGLSKDGKEYHVYCIGDWLKTQAHGNWLSAWPPFVPSRTK